MKQGNDIIYPSFISNVTREDLSQETCRMIMDSAPEASF